MSEKELNEIIATNIKENMDRLGLTQLDVAKYMECSQSTVSNWCKGIKLPRMDKIDKMCSLFGCTRSELMAEETVNKQSILQKAFEERPEMRMLFSVAEDATAEDIQKAIDIIKIMKGNNNG